MMWEILTAQIRGDTSYSQLNHRLVSEEQKGCHKGTRKQVIHRSLTSTSSKRAKQGGKCSHQKRESGIDSKKKKFSWGKNPERHLPERCAFTITICNCKNATKPHTKKCPWGYKSIKLQENINHLMFMDDIKLFEKNEKE